MPVVANPAPGSESPVLQFERQQQEYREHFTFVLNPGLDIGVLYVFALGSLAVYGVILAGWSANSKYSLLGSLRAGARSSATRSRSAWRCSACSSSSARSTSKRSSTGKRATARSG